MIKIPSINSGSYNIFSSNNLSCYSIFCTEAKLTHTCRHGSKFLQYFSGVPKDICIMLHVVRLHLPQYVRGVVICVIHSVFPDKFSTLLAFLYQKL